MCLVADAFCLAWSKGLRLQAAKSLTRPIPHLSRVPCGRSINARQPNLDNFNMEPREKTYFEQQREALIGEIAMVRAGPFRRPPFLHAANQRAC